MRPIPLYTIFMFSIYGGHKAVNKHWIDLFSNNTTILNKLVLMTNRYELPWLHVTFDSHGIHFLFINFYVQNQIRSNYLGNE